MVKKTRSGKKLEQADDLPIIDSADEDQEMVELPLKKSPKKPKAKPKAKEISPPSEMLARPKLGSSFSKKRNFESFSDGSDPFLSSAKGTATSSTIKQGNNDLWIVKYLPFDMDAHVINKKKKEEFVQICKEDKRAKILII